MRLPSCLKQSSTILDRTQDRACNMWTRKHSALGGAPLLLTLRDWRLDNTGKASTNKDCIPFSPSEQLFKCMKKGWVRGLEIGSWKCAYGTHRWVSIQQYLNDRERSRAPCSSNELLLSSSKWRSVRYDMLVQMRCMLRPKMWLCVKRSDCKFETKGITVDKTRAPWEPRLQLLMLRWERWVMYWSASASTTKLLPMPSLPSKLKARSTESLASAFEM